jgi:hypothetical protein
MAFHNNYNGIPQQYFTCNVELFFIGGENNNKIKKSEQSCICVLEAVMYMC